jgi:hypothetical protein
VRLLLEKGVDINAQSGMIYENALQAATKRGHLKLRLFLLENRAVETHDEDISQGDYDESTDSDDYYDLPSESEIE